MRGWNQRALARIGAVGVAACLVTVPAAAASAAVNSTVDGGAYGYNAYTYINPYSTTGAPATFAAGPLPQVTLPSGGSSTPITQSKPSFSDAASAEGLIPSTGALSVSTQGSVGTNPSATSSASVADVSAASQVSVQLATSTCTSNSQGSTGSAHITGGYLDGTIALPDNPAPNTVIGIGPSGAYGTVTLNAQTVHNAGGTTSITVDAVVVNYATSLKFSGQPGEYISQTLTLAQSECSAQGQNVQVPVGTAGGVLLAGVVGVGFLGYQWRRRRRATSTAG